MKTPRTIMPVLDSKIRQTNFEEVAIGYSLEEATLEALRCLDCKKPRCVDACPVRVDIPEFIDFGDSGSLVLTLNNLIIGIILAKMGKYAYACPIKYIKNFGLEFWNPEVT